MASPETIDNLLDRCAVCGCRDIRHWFAMEFGTIGRCRDCGQVLRADRPKRADQVALHQSTQVHEAPYAVLSEQASTELLFFERFLDLCRGGRILDVGCGTGEFLRMAADRGFEPAGIEPVDEFREIAQKKLGGKVIRSQPLEEVELDDESFDAVVLWDVIEHLVDPWSALSRVRRLLKAGGYLGVATINHENVMYALFHLFRLTCRPLARAFGPRLYIPYHTYYFTRSSLARIIQGAGFDVIEHQGYEFPLNRLDVSAALRAGLRGIYLLQRIAGMQGEQYLFARKSAAKN